MTSTYQSVITLLLLVGWNNLQASNDLSAYNSGGARVISGLVGDTQRRQEERSIRDFIWANWQAHELAHIVVTWISREGEPNTYSFLITPNQEGHWCVSVQVARTILHRAGTNIRYESDSWTACTVERKFTVEGTSRRAGKEQPAGDYRLLLIDKDSKIRADI